MQGAFLTCGRDLIGRQWVYRWGGSGCVDGAAMGVSMGRQWMYRWGGSGSRFSTECLTVDCSVNIDVGKRYTFSYFYWMMDKKKPTNITAIFDIADSNRLWPTTVGG